jgi:hypothetical protein
VHLVCLVDDTHTALSKLSHQPVNTDNGPWNHFGTSRTHGRVRLRPRLLIEDSGDAVLCQEQLHAASQFYVASASFDQERAALLRPAFHGAVVEVFDLAPSLRRHCDFLLTEFLILRQNLKTPSARSPLQYEIGNFSTNDSFRTRTALFEQGNE